MRARATCFSFLLLLVAGAEVQAADAFLQFLDTFQAAGECSAGDYVVFDEWPDGSPRTLVSSYRVYSDPCTKALGVFRAFRNGRFKLLADFDYPPTVIELLDLTGNGVPEILVTGPPGNRSAPVAILRWDGARLTQIGESSDYAEYVDLNGDGVAEIVENVPVELNECGVRAGRAYVQRLQNGRYVSVDSPWLADVIVVTKYTEDRQTVVGSPFLPDDRSRRCRVRIVNGTRDGSDRARAVELHTRRVLEGVKEDPFPGKLLPLRLTHAAEYAEGEVELPTRCTLLDITMDGPAGATIAIVVEAVH